MCGTKERYYSGRSIIVMNDNAETAREVSKEIYVMQELTECPNIVQLECAARGGPDGFAFLVMEYLGGGDLFQYAFEDRREFLSEDRIKQLMRDLATGLQAMYDHHILHNDLKPENLLMTTGGGVLKIADFGGAVKLPHGKSYLPPPQRAPPGTPQYMVSVEDRWPIRG